MESVDVCCCAFSEIQRSTTVSTAGACRQREASPCQLSGAYTCRTSKALWLLRLSSPVLSREARNMLSWQRNDSVVAGHCTILLESDVADRLPSCVIHTNVVFRTWKRSKRPRLRRSKRCSPTANSQQDGFKSGSHPVPASQISIKSNPSISACSDATFLLSPFAFFTWRHRT